MEEVKAFRAAKRVEKELLEVTEKIISNAKNLDGLKHWIGKEYWYIRPNGIVEKCKIAKVSIDISENEVKVIGVGERGEYYDEHAFMDEASAKDMGSLVAGTYIHNLEAERDYLQKELDAVYNAMLSAKVPEKHDLSEVEVKLEISVDYIDELIKRRVKPSEYPEAEREKLIELVKARKKELAKEKKVKELKGGIKKLQEKKEELYNIKKKQK